MNNMQKSSKKGLKPYLIKYMALFVGLLYLTNPIHRQIHTVFHEISHLLEAPETLLSHHSHTIEHNQGNHKDGEHILAGADHQHILLDLMDSLLDTSDKQNPADDTTLTLIKCDKHIGSQDYTLPKIIPFNTSQNRLMVEQKIRLGHFYIVKEPPQLRHI